MEISKFWRSPDIAGVELLKASFLNFEFKRHWHDELAIGVIEKGAEGISYRGSKVTIAENKIVAINPSEIHTGYAASEQGWTYRMFYFDPQILKDHLEYYPAGLTPLLKSPVLDDPKLFNQLRLLHISLEGSSLNLSKQSLLNIALKRLFTVHGEHNLPSMANVTDKSAMTEVRDYLMDNWNENINLSELEVISGLSKYHLIRQFQKTYGVPPHQFLLLTKVMRAKKLLLSGVRCADAALTCGFYDQSHLTRNFKRVVGVSPSGYKANLVS